MYVAGIVFLAALLLIAILFALKQREVRTGRYALSGLRAHADRSAADLKVLIARAKVEAEKLPPTTLYFSRWLVHEAALGFAAIARSLESRAHSVADMVSHKRGFQPKAPRSEFLKQMNDHKNGNGSQESEDDIIVN